MSEFQTGTVTEIKIIPYEPAKDTSLDPNSSNSPYNYHNIIENLSSVKETIILSIEIDGEKTFPIVERSLDLGITSSWFYALNCFTVRLYDPSVLFASIAVECVLNHDLRLVKLRQSKSYEWLDLNWKNPACAFYEGLPIKSLMNPNEKFEKNGIEFVERRNKVAHGDIEGYSGIYPPQFASKDFGESDYMVGYPRPSKYHALDQIEKAKNFIIEWAKSNPKVRLHQI